MKYSGPSRLFSLFIVILILSSCTEIKSQSYTKNKINFEETDQDSLNIGFQSNMEIYQIHLMLEMFTKHLVINNIKLNQTDKSNYIRSKVEISDFNKKYGDELDNTVAIALGANVDSIIHIDINKVLWNKMLDIEKLSTIFHEVCHDLLNVKHIEGDKLNLMHPYAQPSDFNELQIMLDKFIRDYKTGRVKTFDEGFYIHDNTKTKKPYLKKTLK